MFAYYVYGILKFRSFFYGKALVCVNFFAIRRMAFILSTIFFFATNFLSLLLFFSDFAYCEVSHPLVVNIFRQIDTLLDQQINSESFNKVRTSHREYSLCFSENIFTEQFRQTVDDFAWLGYEAYPSARSGEVCPFEQKIVLKIHEMCLQELFIKPNFHLYGNDFTCDSCKIFIDRQQTIRFVQFTCFFELVNMLEAQDFNFRRLCLDPVIGYDLQAKKFCDLVKHAWVLHFLNDHLPINHRENAHLLLDETLKMVNTFENCHQYFCGLVYDSIEASRHYYFTRGQLPPGISEDFKNEAISLLPSHWKNPPQAMSAALRGTSFPFFRRNGTRTLCDTHYENLTPPLSDGAGPSSLTDWSKIFGDGLL